MKRIIFITILILTVAVLLRLPPGVKAQQSSTCAIINSVSASSGVISLDSPFTCNVTVDQNHAGSETIACGISIDGGYPENYCPSDTAFGGWNAATAKFNCTIPAANVPSTAQKVELVAFDFRTECGLPKAKKSALLLTKNTPTPAPTAAQGQNAATQPTTPTGNTNNDKTGESNIQSNNGSTVGKPFTRGYTNSSSSTGSLGQAALGPAGSQSISELLNKKQIQYASSIITASQDCLANKDIYQQASQITGVPWQVIAAIHFREGNCKRTASLVGGSPLGTAELDLMNNCSRKNAGPGKPVPVNGGCGFNSILDSAIYSANHLKSKVNAIPSTVEQLALALTRYNGGGNANCGKTPYTGCPKYYDGEDDPYVMSLFDERHKTMFIRYCSNGTLCSVPIIDTRPGTMTVTQIISSL